MLLLLSIMSLELLMENIALPLAYLVMTSPTILMHDYTSYFTDDAIFYFVEGTHTLQGTLEISGVSNITLQGLGHIEQGRQLCNLPQ